MDQQMHEPWDCGNHVNNETMAMVNSLTIRMPTSEKRALKSLFSATEKKSSRHPCMQGHVHKPICQPGTGNRAIRPWGIEAIVRGKNMG